MHFLYTVPRHWFVLDKKGKPHQREILGLSLSDLLLAFIFGSISMPVAWRWSGWLLCWAIFVALVLCFPPVNRLPRRTLTVLALCLIGCFFGICFPTAYAQWREEKASALEGDLFLPESNAKQKIIEFGEGGTRVEAGPNGRILSFFADANLDVENDKGHLLLSTEVRDQQGKVVVKLEKNHWSVSPDKGICLDKNYSRDALEVKDGRDHIVFQLRLYPDRIQLQGEWFNDGGEDVLVVVDPNKKDTQIILKGSKYDPKIDAIMIGPVFQYPSSRHWAEWETHVK